MPEVAESLTPEELKRLRIPVSKLPGMDYRGLDIYNPKTGETAIAQRVVEPRIGNAEVDLADSSTADRVVRWLATQVGLEAGCSAPIWSRFGVRGRRWRLGVPNEAYATDWYAGLLNEYAFSFAVPDGDYPPRVNRKVIPPEYEIDPLDVRRLPDGSYYVDRLALRHASVFMGKS